MAQAADAETQPETKFPLKKPTFEIRFGKGVPMGAQDHFLTNLKDSLEAYAQRHGGDQILIRPQSDNVCSLRVIGQQVGDGVRNFHIRKENDRWRLRVDRGAVPA